MVGPEMIGGPFGRAGSGWGHSSMAGSGREAL